MPIRLTTDPARGVVRYLAAGAVSPAEFDGFLARATAPPFRPGFGFLGDHRAADPPLPADVRRYVAAMDARARELGGGMWAVVATPGVGFGMARMWSLLADGWSGLRLAAFTDPAAAEAWLGLGGRGSRAGSAAQPESPAR